MFLIRLFVGLLKTFYRWVWASQNIWGKGRRDLFIFYFVPLQFLFHCYSVCVCVCVCLSVCLCVYLFVCLSVRPSVCLSVCLSVDFSMYLTVHLSVTLYFCKYIYTHVRSSAHSLALIFFYHSTLCLSKIFTPNKGIERFFISLFWS